MPSTFNWVCPHCERAQTINSENHHFETHAIRIAGLAEGELGIAVQSIGCTNADCSKVTIDVRVGRRHWANPGYVLAPGDALLSRRLVPSSSSRVIPDYVPQAVREDYYEACLIKTESPKASATLARRCIQGMIRDFGKISGRTLFDEINNLKSAVENGNAPQGVTVETIEAIDHVRGIGNIGAHMERDIDLIIPVDPDEAQALIDLIEMLFDEWYIAREKRLDRLRKISRIGLAKQQAKQAKQAKDPEVANDKSSDGHPDSPNHG